MDLKKPRKKKVMSSFYIEAELYSVFRETCKLNGLSFTDGIHNGILLFLEQMKERA